MTQRHWTYPNRRSTLIEEHAGSPIICGYASRPKDMRR
jgi:hypothetical protein